MMSGGHKPVQDGVRVPLPQGVTWDSLAAMTPNEIRDRGLLPAGFMPLPHVKQATGGQVFPQRQIDQIQAQEKRDLRRFDVNFDLPDHLTPEFPPPIFLTTHPELGDVSRGQLLTIKNFYEVTASLRKGRRFWKNTRTLRHSMLACFRRPSRGALRDHALRHTEALGADTRHERSRRSSCGNASEGVADRRRADGACRQADQSRGNERGAFERSKEPEEITTNYLSRTYRWLVDPRRLRISRSARMRFTAASVRRAAASHLLCSASSSLSVSFSNAHKFVFSR
jgi:hypothetical protein